MDKCEVNYGKHCFNCKEMPNNLVIVSVGAGMGWEMIEDIGERKIGISCPPKKGYLILDLNKRQVKELTEGKLEKLSHEDTKNGKINSKMILDYVAKNTDHIETYETEPCTVAPPSP